MANTRSAKKATRKIARRTNVNRNRVSGTRVLVDRLLDRLAASLGDGGRRRA